MVFYNGGEWRGGDRSVKACRHEQCEEGAIRNEWWPLGDWEVYPYLYTLCIYWICSWVTDITIIWPVKGAFQVALVVKNPPANAGETWVQSLGPEDPLKEGRATHSNVLAWRIPWTEEPGGLQSMGLQRVRHNWSDLAQQHKHNGRVMEKEMAAHSSVLAWRIPGKGAWWAAVYGVAQSRTRLT